jgi:hypothetical protein
VRPRVATISDIGQTDTPVLYYQTATFMAYLLGSGILRASQVDASYDGTPSRFAADGGKDAVQGYATNVLLLRWDTKPAAHQEDVPTPGTDTQNVFLCRDLLALGVDR